MPSWEWYRRAGQLLFLAFLVSNVDFFFSFILITVGLRIEWWLGWGLGWGLVSIAHEA